MRSGRDEGSSMRPQCACSQRRCEVLQLVGADVQAGQGPQAAEVPDFVPVCQLVVRQVQCLREATGS